MNDEISVQTRGRWFDILTGLGIHEKHLVNRHVECPLCTRPKKFRFDNKEGKGTFICTCMSGDGMKLVMQYFGWDFNLAAVEIRKILGMCKMAIHKPVNTQKELRDNEARLKRIHSGLQRITPKNPAGLYLINRGLDVTPETDCYFHPAIPYFDNGEKIGVFPAMVSKFRDSSGYTCTLHITYLTLDGKKMECDSPRKVLPKIKDLKGGAMRLFKHGEMLGIAEGVESALAAYQMDGTPTWAACNANLLANFIPPEEVKTIIIYTDEDKSFTGQKAAYHLANRLVVQCKKEVIVKRLIGDVETNDFYEDYHDKGLGIDWLDYLNINTVTSKKSA